MASRITLDNMCIDVHDAETEELLGSIPMSKEGMEKIKEAIDEMVCFDSNLDMLSKVAWDGYEAKGSPYGKVDLDNPHISIYASWNAVIVTDR